MIKLPSICRHPNEAETGPGSSEVEAEVTVVEYFSLIWKKQEAFK